MSKKIAAYQTSCPTGLALDIDCIQALYRENGNGRVTIQGKELSICIEDYEKLKKIKGKQCDIVFDKDSTIEDINNYFEQEDPAQKVDIQNQGLKMEITKMP